MADTTFLVQVAIPHDSAIPKDGVVNTFHFRGPEAPTELQRTSLLNRITGFYNGVHSPGLYSVGSNLSSRLNGDAATIKAYDLNDAKPRTPVIEETVSITVGSAADGSLPNEVALVGSYQAAKVSGLNQARRRGRLYIGPLSVVAASAVAGQDPRPAVRLVDALVGAMDDLATDNDELEWEWVVYSPTNAAQGGTSFAPVSSGWVDNAWDTQRRRGLAATARTTWTKA